jgi:Na+-translocating ferredoxin:NAD+ oxidoreductase RNF subunit RnfB
MVGARVFGVPWIVIAALAVAVVVGVPVLRPRHSVPKAPGHLVEPVLDVLPGGNCGACGNDSCFETATAIACGRAPYTACSAGGAATAKAVATVLGIDAQGRTA